MKLIYAACAALLAGCASTSANMKVGTEHSAVSAADQRAAVLAVKEYPAVPAGAAVIGKVDASRCHRNSLQAAPTKEDLLADLKVAAYARGADGIASIEETRESGLLLNCWYIVTARATAFRLSR